MCIVKGSKRSLILHGETRRIADCAGWQACHLEKDAPKNGGYAAHDELDLGPGEGEDRDIYSTSESQSEAGEQRVMSLFQT